MRTHALGSRSSGKRVLDLVCVQYTHSHADCPFLAMSLFPLLVFSLTHGMQSHSFQLGSEAMFSRFAPCSSARLHSCKLGGLGCREYPLAEPPGPHGISACVRLESGGRQAEQLPEGEVRCRLADEPTALEPLVEVERGMPSDLCGRCVYATAPWWRWRQQRRLHVRHSTCMGLCERRALQFSCTGPDLQF